MPHNRNEALPPFRDAFLGSCRVLRRPFSVRNSDWRGAEELVDHRYLVREKQSESET